MKTKILLTILSAALGLSFIGIGNSFAKGMSANAKEKEVAKMEKVKKK